MSIKPVNGHLLIEPVKHESFMASQRETFEEVGVIVAIQDPLTRPDGLIIPHPELIKVGDKVFFDSWLAAKYPKNETEYFWLVKWEDVRAIEHNEAISE